MMWSKQVGHELYVYHDGRVIYKRWTTKSGNKTQPSVIFNDNGWPNVEVIEGKDYSQITHPRRFRRREKRLAREGISPPI